jgi:hypothetical protein
VSGVVEKVLGGPELSTQVRVIAALFAQIFGGVSQVTGGFVGPASLFSDDGDQ